MAVSPASVPRMGGRTEDDVIGLTPHEYLPADIADKYLADDRRVLRTGEPLVNVVEVWINEQRLRDWIVTDKYPLRDRTGAVVGLIGTLQSFQDRRRQLAHLGPVGEAADYIEKRLDVPLRLGEVADAVGYSERHLERLFRQGVRDVGLAVRGPVADPRGVAGADAVGPVDHADRRWPTGSATRAPSAGRSARPPACRRKSTAIATWPRRCPAIENSFAVYRLSNGTMTRSTSASVFTGGTSVNSSQVSSNSALWPGTSVHKRADRLHLQHVLVRERLVARAQVGILRPLVVAEPLHEQRPLVQYATQGTGWPRPILVGPFFGSWRRKM